MRVLKNHSQIYLLHRVIHRNKEHLPYLQSLDFSPKKLEKFILKYKKTHSFISIDKVYEAIINNEPLQNCICLTLDDGYKDNLEIAFPIFKKLDVPFCIYITTSLVEGNGLLWWSVLHDISKNNRTLSYQNETYNLNTAKRKNEFCMKFYKKITGKNMKKNDVESLFKVELAPYLGNIDFFSYNRNLMLSWEQLRLISKDPLCTIGAHCVDHYVLNNLSESEIIFQMEESKNILETQLQLSIKHFSYPNGNQNELTNKILNETKIFQTAVSCIPNYLYNNCDPLNLPRINLNNKNM